MSYGEKYTTIMEQVTNQKVKDLFDNIISEIPLKEDIILINEGLCRFTNKNFSIFFLNEKQNVKAIINDVIMNRIDKLDVVIRCNDIFEHDNIEDNDIIVLTDNEKIIICDHENYVDIVKEMKFTEETYKKILSFCIEYEVVKEKNAYYLKKEFGEQKERLLWRC